MNIRDLIGQRLLIKRSGHEYGSREGDVEEIKILEVSPSGEWAKVMNQNGQKFWRLRSGIAVVEALLPLRGGEERPA